jgi:hypothetical protein
VSGNHRHGQASRSRPLELGVVLDDPDNEKSKASEDGDHPGEQGGDGKLLEVYRPVWTPGGQPLLFETYFRYDVGSQRSHQLWRAFAGVMLSCLVALVLLLAGVGWLLMVRSRRARANASS